MPDILLVNNAEPGIRSFAEPIEQLITEQGSRVTFVEYEQCLYINFKRFDGAILTGSPKGNDIVEHHIPYFRWIADFAKPLLGICAGHHITGFLFGAELLRSREAETGDFEVEIIRIDPIFKGLSKLIKVKQMHNDSVTLPDDFILLATSKTCVNQVMKHKQKPLYTCQFHPEYYNQRLIQNFIDLCG